MTNQMTSPIVTETKTPEPDHTVSTCNALLRGELSAVETYSQAIDKFSDQPEVEVLERIRAEHEANAALLAASVERLGGEAESGSGAWGTFAQAVQGAANLFGEGSAIGSLKSGEQWGLGQYEAAADDGAVAPATRALIRDQFMPHTREHIATLDALGAVV